VTDIGAAIGGAMQIRHIAGVSAIQAIRGKNSARGDSPAGAMPHASNPNDNAPPDLNSADVQGAMADG
jgi:hypothetical protein